MLKAHPPPPPKRRLFIFPALSLLSLFLPGLSSFHFQSFIHILHYSNKLLYLLYISCSSLRLLAEIGEALTLRVLPSRVFRLISLLPRRDINFFQCDVCHSDSFIRIASYGTAEHKAEQDAR